MLNALVLLIILIPGFVLGASDSRLSHARELMGNRYSKSVVSKATFKDGVEKNILKTVKQRLPKAYRSKAQAISKTIINEATKHQLDPYFLMAVIAGESSFNPLAVGPVGEIGLMQIRPKTGKWMAERAQVKWKGKTTLQDPIANIKLGAAYLSWLRDHFEGNGQLYLAAYNMGPKSVKNALERNVRPKDYPRHVMKRYLAFYKEASANL